MIIVRHCQSLSNIGQSSDIDSELSPFGIIQARRLRRELPGYHVISSPYLRCKQTAAKISDHFSIDRRLIEYTSKPGFLLDGTRIYLESESEILNRLKSFYDEYSQQDVIVVTHGTPVAILHEAKFNNIPRWDDSIYNGIILR